MVDPRSVPPSEPTDPEPASPKSSSAPIQWYHPDPDTPYEELRSGLPGVGKAILIGLAIAVVGVGLMYAAAWVNSGKVVVTPKPARYIDDHWAPATTSPATRPAPATQAAHPADAIRVGAATTQASAR